MTSSLASSPDDRGAGGFPHDAFAWLAEVEAGHFWFEARNRLIVWALGRYFPAATTLLEIGCGTGFVLNGIHRAYPQLNLAGRDPAAAALEVARRRVPTATLSQEDARTMTDVDRFDVVCAFDVLEHIPDDRDILTRLHAATRPSGGVLLTVPQHPWLWSRADDYGHHVRRYRRRELLQRLGDAGFRPLRVTSFVTLLLPLLAASRWADRRRTGAMTHSELQVNPHVNRLLASVLRFERAGIRLGLSWPAGGSLLVVAARSEVGQ